MAAIVEVVARAIHQHQLTLGQVLVVGQRILERNLQAAEGSFYVPGCMSVDKIVQAEPDAL